MNDQKLEQGYRDLRSSLQGVTGNTRENCLEANTKPKTRSDKFTSLFLFSEKDKLAGGNYNNYPMYLLDVILSIIIFRYCGDIEESNIRRD